MGMTNPSGGSVADLTGLGAGVAAFLATPSSANLASAVTGETGTGALVFASSPTIGTALTISNPGTAEAELFVDSTGGRSSLIYLRGDIDSIFSVGPAAAPLWRLGVQQNSGFGTDFTVLSLASNVRTFGINQTTYATTIYRGAVIESGTAATIGAVVRGAASQTADLIQGQTSGAVAVCGFGPTGFMYDPGVSRVTGDVTNITATMANITGLSATLIAGRKYVGELTVFADDSVAVDGLKFDFDGGTATATSFVAGISGTPLGATVGVGTSAALATDLTVTTATTGTIAYNIPFTIVVNAAGTFIPRFAQVSHTTGTATVRLGSYMNLRDCPT